ncbi:MAG: hypothetical protein ABS58_13665 [Mesorhizobium sp. SCN 65-20]|nr:MAG: hypothetical protein ABS58_13665 [Mesorhizobium sp. SCN 65-20]
MADFVAVLKKTLDGMGDTTPAMRARVYDKARSTIAAKLAALDPQPPAAIAERQTKVLEDAIATVEAEFAAVPSSDDPLAELENVFSSIDRNKNQPVHTRAPEAPRPVTPVAPPPPPAAREVEPAPATQPERYEPLPEFGANRDDEYAAGPESEAEHEDQFDDTPSNNTDPFQRTRQKPRRRLGRMIAALLALAVVGAGGYALWANRDALTSAGTTETPDVTTPPEKEAVTPAPATGGQNGEPATDTPPTKFTQRMTPEGKETDPGPAAGNSGIGEGTSVATLTQAPPAAPATPAPSTPAAPVQPDSPAANPAPAASENAQVAVGQKAIFYEERTNVAQGSAEQGSVVWSVVQESPGGDLPPEPAIRAEATIPGKDIQLRMTIRRNADKTLPASHILEMIFLTPDGFEGGGIENILRVAMKSSEQDAGNSLIGIPAKIADGFFLVALNDTKPEIDTNLGLLRRQSWIDVPVVYKSGRRALFTLEKGIPGDKVFEEAMKAWQAKAAG